MFFFRNFNFFFKMSKNSSNVNRVVLICATHVQQSTIPCSQKFCTTVGDNVPKSNTSNLSLASNKHGQKKLVIEVKQAKEKNWKLLNFKKV